MVRVIGNSQQQSQTIAAVESSTVTVLSGPRHVGKRTFIKSYASTMCDVGDLTIAGGSVGDARSVSSFLRQMPLMQARRVVLVDCYDGISDAAQDAYLKPCEELPSTASVVFLVEDHMHLSAPLTSRVKSVIRWAPLSPSEMDEFLGDVGGDGVTAEACCGLPGLYDTMSHMDVHGIIDFVLDERSFLKPVPMAIKDIPSGRSYGRDAVCSILKYVAVRLLFSGNVLRARKALSLASVLYSIPSSNVDIHWRHAWNVLDVM